MSTIHYDSSDSGRRVDAFVACIVNDPLPVQASSQHLVMCMFVLSALDPDKMVGAIAKLARGVC